MVTRLIIVSYFLALGFGVIPGSEIWRLTAPLLPDTFAGLVANALVITLATCVLLGVYRRTAALVLAMVVFWPGYLAMMASAEAVGGFWRDLALISGLLMCAGIGGQADPDHVAAEDRTTPTPGPAQAHEQVLVASHQIDARPRTRSVQERFRQDFDLVRLS